MKSTKLIFLVFFVFALFQLDVQAQVSKVKELEAKPYYKTLASSEALTTISKADKYELKADGYMDQGRSFNRGIDDLEQMESISRDDAARISALKKLTKLKKSRLSKLKKAYKYYSKANTLRYSAYQKMLPNGRMRKGQTNYDKIFNLEKSAHTSWKEAERIRKKASDLKGEDLRVALANTYNYENLAINNIVDVFAVCNNDFVIDTVQVLDPVVIPRVRDIAGFYFTVDVGMFNSRPDTSVFKGMTPVYEDSLGYVFQYVAGKFRMYNDAELAKKRIVELGFDGAYVTAYENGIRMPISTAIDLANANAVVFAPVQPFLIGNQVVNSSSVSEIVSVVHTDIKKIDVQQNVNPDHTNPLITATDKLTATEIDLYQSKESVISQRLNIGGEDIKRLYTAAQLEFNADLILADVEKIYEDIKLYRRAEAAERDLNKKEDYRDDRVVLEVKQFVLLIKATELHLRVNEERYSIYKKHLVKVGRAVESPLAMKGKDFELSSEANYYLSKNCLADANALEAQADKYLKLMEAKDRLLLAIENQEMAFSIYFDLVSDDDIKAIANIDYNPADIYTVNDLVDDKNSDKPEHSKVRKYIVYNTYIYSKMSPQLKKVAPLSGVVFKIQFGLFKELPEDNFGSLSPITVERLKGKKYSRFLVGNFRTWEGVKEALPIVKGKGYKTAYIVAFRDGLRIEPIAGRNIARTQPKYDKLVHEEILVVKGKKVKATPTKLGDIVAGDLSKTTGLVYTVQLGVFKKVLTSKELATTENVNFERLDNGLIRYTKGMYNDKMAADRERERLKKNGVDGVFVVAYFNGSRANMKEISKASSVRSLTSTKVKEKNALVFKVQLAAVTSISTQLSARYKKLQSEFNFIKTQNERGLTILSVGDYSSYDKANEAKKALKEKGFKDGFIVAYKKNKQIPISIALRIQK